MNSLSIVIPTHNRPNLLLDAIESALDSYDNIVEIIVIDDASDVPVDAEQLRSRFGEVVRVHRNDKALGIAKVRVLGGELASGDFMFQLDDDDLLSPGALSVAISTLRSLEADILYVGVEGFGENAEYFNSGQRRSLEKLFEKAEAFHTTADTFRFRKLFLGLLQSAPSAFQHPLAATETWKEVNALRLRAFNAEGVLQPEHKKGIDPSAALIDPLNECEWALYAAAYLEIGFLDRPIYRARCEGIRNYSTPEQRNKHQEANRLMKKRLYLSSKFIEPLNIWRNNLLDSYTETMFDTAYYSFHTEENRVKAWGQLYQSARVSARFYMLKFLFRTLLPFKLNVYQIK